MRGASFRDARPTFALWFVSTVLATVVVLMVYAGDYGPGSVADRGGAHL